jgi:hypothetical protein
MSRSQQEAARTPRDADELERRLDELASDCGCGAGSVAMLVAAAGFAVWAFAADATLGWLLLAEAAGVMLLAATAGKLLWLARNRVLLRRLRLRLESGTGR